MGVPSRTHLGLGSHSPRSSEVPSDKAPSLAYACLPAWAQEILLSFLIFIFLVLPAKKESPGVNSKIEALMRMSVQACSLADTETNRNFRNTGAFGYQTVNPSVRAQSQGSMPGPGESIFWCSWGWRSPCQGRAAIEQAARRFEAGAL